VKHHALAARWFQKAAEQGCVEAQYNLGNMHDQEQGVKQDDAEAVRLYHKAAEQGCVEAQFNLGVSYANGQGVKQNYALASRWYRKAAERGLQESKDALSNLPPCPQVCANCGVVEKTGAVILKPCGRCKVVKYCGKVCQMQHWKDGGHQSTCK